MRTMAPTNAVLHGAIVYAMSIMSIMQRWVTLVDSTDQTSDYLRPIYIDSVNLSLNIDPGQRVGMSTLKSHGCSLCAPATNTDGTTTRGRIVATSDPGSLLMVSKWQLARLWAPTE